MQQAAAEEFVAVVALGVLGKISCIVGNAPGARANRRDTSAAHPGFNEQLLDEIGAGAPFAPALTQPLSMSLPFRVPVLAASQPERRSRSTSWRDAYSLSS